MLPSPPVHTAGLPGKAAAMGWWHPESRAGLQEPRNEAKGIASRWEHTARAGKKVTPCVFLEASALGALLGSGLLSLALQAFVMPLHTYPAALPVLAVAPQLRLWLMCQPTLLPTVPSPCHRLWVVLLSSCIPSLFPSAAFGPHQGT